MILSLVVDFSGVGYLMDTEEKRVMRRLKCYGIEMKRFFSEVYAKLISPILYQPNLLSVGIPRFQTSS